MRILIVEDEPKTGDYLKQGLLEAGFVVDLARDGTDGLHQALTEPYDLAILDVMLPGLDGWSVLAGLRRAGKDLPVLFLSAHDQVADRVKGLELGADDYLVKPYDLAELSARVKAIVRRSQAVNPPAQSQQTFGPLTLLPASNAVLWHGNTIVLTAKEFRVLEALLQRQNRIVTRQQLEAEIYGWNESVGSNAIEVHIHHLRRKISGELIQTVRGVGYQVGTL